MTDTNTDGSGIVGQSGLNDATSDFNQQESQIDRALGRIATLKPVKVVAVTNAGGLSAVGFVDVVPLVNLVDGLLGSSMKNETVHGIPYVRLQGGKNAIIMDPVVGDLGYVSVSDRDISSVKETKDFANPSSFRRFSLSDGIYVGGILNDVPEQYVQFNSDGVNIVDKNGNKVEMTSTGIKETSVGGTIMEFKSDGFHFNKQIFVNGALNLFGSLNGFTGGIYPSGLTISGTISAADLQIPGHVAYTVHEHSYLVPVTSSGGGQTGTPT